MILVLDNKVFINLYVLQLDKSFEVFLPINEKVGNILALLQKNFFAENIRQMILLNVQSGNIYNNNDLIRNTDIKNGTKLMII